MIHIHAIKILLLSLFFSSNTLFSQTEFSADKLVVHSTNPDLIIKYQKELANFSLVHFNQSSLDTLIQNIYNDGLCQNVGISIHDRVLVINITPKPFISRISIHGNTFFKNEELLRELKVKQGDLIENINIKNLKSTLAQKYYHEGFLEIDVEITAIEISENGGTLLSIVIFERKRFKLKEINFSGTKSIDIERLKQKMNLRPGKFIRFSKILSGISKVEEYLVRLGYFRAIVNLPIIEKIDNTANLNIFISQGPKMSFEFNGSRIDSNKKLLNVLKGDGNIPRAEADKIIEYYKSQGYHFVNVSLKKQVIGKSHERYTFNIDKGSRIKIEAFEYHGNSFADEERLNKIVYDSLKSIKYEKIYYEKAITYALSSIRDFYLEHGFINSSVLQKETRISNNRALISVNITENTSFTISDINIWGNKAFKGSDLLFDLIAGNPYSNDLLNEVKRKILRKYLVAGFVDCEVECKAEIYEKNKKAAITISISEGERALIGTIDIRGNNKTHDYVIRNRITLKINEPLNPDEIFNTERAIQKTGLFDRVSILDDGKIGDSNLHRLIIEVKEKKGIAVEYGFGFATLSPNNPFYFDDNLVRVHASFKHNNLAGKGESFYAKAQVSPHLTIYSDDAQILEWKANVGYKEPDVLSSTIDFATYYQNLRESRISYDLDKNSFLANIERDFENIVKISTGYTFEFSRTFNRIDENDRLLRLGSWGVMLNKNIARKRNVFSGLFSNLEFNLFTHKFLSEEDFYKIFMRNDLSFSLFRDFVGLLLSIRGGYADLYGLSTDVPIEKRFFLGGTGSMRGFVRDYVGTPATFLDTNPIGGNILLNYIVELTLPIYKDLKFAIFTDGGNLYADINDFDIKNLRNSTGIGLHYNTPIGPVKLDYGFIMDREASEGVGAFHFSIGIL